MSTPSIQPGFQQVTRHHTIFQKRVDDAYKIKGKLPEPTICPQCSAYSRKDADQPSPSIVRAIDMNRQIYSRLSGCSLEFPSKCSILASVNNS